MAPRDGFGTPPRHAGTQKQESVLRTKKPFLGLKSNIENFCRSAQIIALKTAEPWGKIK